MDMEQLYSYVPRELVTFVLRGKLLFSEPTAPLPLLVYWVTCFIS